MVRINLHGFGKNYGFGKKQFTYILETIYIYFGFGKKQFTYILDLVRIMDLVRKQLTYILETIYIVWYEYTPI